MVSLKKEAKIIFNLVIGLMFLAAIVFLGIFIYTELENNMYSLIALSCSLIGNFLNLIKHKLQFNCLIEKQ